MYAEGGEEDNKIYEEIDGEFAEGDDIVSKERHD